MREVFVGVDTGHCTGWGIVVREDDGSLNLFGAGIVPIVSEQLKARKTMSFWENLLLPFEHDKVYVCVESNVGVGFSTSKFFVEDQRLSPTLIELIGQQQGNPFEFIEIGPTQIARLFGVKNVLAENKVKKEKKNKKGDVVKTSFRRPVIKTAREQLRERVVELFQIDQQALSKSLDAWDSLTVAIAGYYIKYGGQGDFSMFIAMCTDCSEKILVSPVPQICGCKSMIVSKPENGRLSVIAKDQKKVSVLGIPNSAFAGIVDQVVLTKDFDFKKIDM